MAAVWYKGGGCTVLYNLGIPGTCREATGQSTGQSLLKAETVDTSPVPEP